MRGSAALRDSTDCHHISLHTSDVLVSTASSCCTFALGRPGVSKVCWKYSDVLSLSSAGVSCSRLVTLVVTAMLPTPTPPHSARNQIGHDQLGAPRSLHACVQWRPICISMMQPVICVTVLGKCIGASHCTEATPVELLQLDLQFSASV